MPGIRPRRNSFTRLMSSSTRRAPVPSGGVGINRVPRTADRSSGSGGNLGVFGELHYIDDWVVVEPSADIAAKGHAYISFDPDA